MKLSRRLSTIADLIPKKSMVIDVGCDHALLDIYLCKYKKCTCLAIDSSKGSLEKARINVEKSNTLSHVKLLLNDGLNGIKVDNDSYVVLAGMGTYTIMRILNQANNNITNLIVQTNTDVKLLCDELIKFGYYVVDKIEVTEKKKYYVINLKKLP